METQWYLCEIIDYPKNEGNRLKKTDNLSAHYPDVFLSSLRAMIEGERLIVDNEQGQGQWYVWLPIIPRVGDVLQFAGWQVQVSYVLLETEWESTTGIKEGMYVSARIKIRQNIVPRLMDSHFAIESRDNDISHPWEQYARRGHDLQYYAWELRHEAYAMEPDETGTRTYYRWHTRIRPVAGDVIEVQERRWRVTEVGLASANLSVDGWLTLEER